MKSQRPKLATHLPEDATCREVNIRQAAALVSNAATPVLIATLNLHKVPY